MREGVISNTSGLTVTVGEVSSASKAIPASMLESAIMSSLEGQKLLADVGTEAAYILSADFVKSSAPTWGTKTKVNVETKYTLTDAKNGQVLVSRNHNETCVSSVDFKQTISEITLPSLQEIIGSTASMLTFGVDLTPGDTLDVKSRTALPGSAEDIAMGLPKASTPISSNDAYFRGVYARECAIRKTILQMMTDILLQTQ